MAKNETANAAEEVEGAVRIKPDLEKYVNGVSGSGKRTKNCGDDVAQITDGFTVEELAAVTSKMRDIPANDLLDKYDHLNVGMQAMNLRNLIRGAVTKLDKAHEDDKAVVAGIPTLKLLGEKGQAAVTKRQVTAEKEAAAKAAAAEKKAAAKEKAEAAKAKATEGKKAA
jgi:hypothetical protein